MFNATHTINGAPVIKCKRANGLPYFRNEAGETVRHGKGAPSVELKTTSVPVAVIAPEPEPVIPALEPGEIVFHSPEVAAAIYRAATWPAVGEAIGYAETSRGDSATLIGPMTVRICERTPSGGKWSVVRIPDAVGFEVAEERL